MEKYESQAKYHEKTGTKPYSFRLKRTIAEPFKAKCDEKGEKYANVVMDMMKGYIEGER